MSEQDLKEILLGLKDSDGDIDVDDLPEEFTLLVDDDRTQEHKYQMSAPIVQHRDSGRLFCVNRSRTGSYHSDWHYGEAYVTEVRKVQKTIVVDTYEAI